jgi:hypothetical protein
MSTAIVSLLILAMPVASIAWTVTHEELFREFREWCERKSKASHGLAARKFFYIFTCEYCFSHYVAALAVAATGYVMLFDDWRGYLVSWCSLVWIANVYMSLYARLRLDITHERLDIAADKKGRKLESVK